MTPSEIIERVSVYREIPIGLIKGKTRRRDAVNARHGAMWLMRKHLPFVVLKQIGFLFGGRDHSTVIHGIDAVNDSLSINDGQFRWVNKIELGKHNGDRLLEKLFALRDLMEKGYQMQAGALLNEVIEFRQTFLNDIAELKADQVLENQN